MNLTNLLKINRSHKEIENLYKFKVENINQKASEQDENNDFFLISDKSLFFISFEYDDQKYFLNELILRRLYDQISYEEIKNKNQLSNKDIFKTILKEEFEIISNDDFIAFKNYYIASKALKNLISYFSPKKLYLYYILGISVIPF